jgi:GNAT superfamily N-acetyltransferase
MRCRLPTSSATSDFATDPGAYLEHAPETSVHDRERFYATVVGEGRFVNACRLRFEPADAAEVMREVRRLAPDGIGSWQTPSGELATALREAGARDPEPPLDPSFTALATETPPPEVDGVEIRQVDTFEAFVEALEIVLSAEQYTDDVRDRRRGEAREAYERRRARPGGDWVALLDGEPVGFASAEAGQRGMLLAGGATLPRARGRGVYRALVRARWEAAAARGTPALAVQAQETSRPILERCGFEPVATVYELEHDPE